MFNLSLKNIILIISVIVIMYCLRRNKEGMVNTGDINKAVREEISKIYKVDIQSIRNLEVISKKLQEGRLTIPGNLTIDGNITVKGSSNLRGNLENNSINNKINNINNNLNNSINNINNNLNNRINSKFNEANNNTNNKFNDINSRFKRRLPQDNTITFPGFGKIIGAGAHYHFIDLNSRARQLAASNFYRWGGWR